MSSMNGSAYYQFQSDLDQGGNFSVKRFSESTAIGATK